MKSTFTRLGAQALALTLLSLSLGSLAHAAETPPAQPGPVLRRLIDLKLDVSGAVRLGAGLAGGDLLKSIEPYLTTYSLQVEESPSGAIQTLHAIHPTDPKLSVAMPLVDGKYSGDFLYDTSGKQASLKIEVTPSTDGSAWSIQLTPNDKVGKPKREMEELIAFKNDQGDWATYRTEGEDFKKISRMEVTLGIHSIFDPTTPDVEVEFAARARKTGEQSATRDVAVSNTSKLDRRPGFTPQLPRSACEARSADLL